MSAFTLPPTIASPQDVSNLLIEIKEYARWFEHEMVKRKMHASGQSTQPILTHTTNEYLRELNAAQSLTTGRLEKLIADLERYKEVAPRLTITLAAPVTPPIRHQLIEWCRTNLSPDTLITFQFNSTLLGGLVVRCGSRVFDWSFRRQLLNNQQQLTETFAHVR